MPELTNDELKQLDNITGLGQRYNPKPHLDRASFLNPDVEAENIKLAESKKLPLDTVERNADEIKRRDALSQINLDGYPTLREFLADDRNARVSIDDIPNLQGLEDALREDGHGYWSNVGRGALNRVNALTGNLVQLAGNLGKDFERFMVDDVGLPNPGITIGEDGVSFSWNMPTETPSLIAETGKAVSEGNGYSYQPRFTWENFKGDMSPRNLAGYVAEQGIQSIPDMIAAVYTLPAYIGSRTEEIAEARVANDERTDVTTSDLATSLIPAVTVALIERLSGKFVLSKGGVQTPMQALKRTGQATVLEGGTEFIQEGIEYIGETAFTKKDLSLAEMVDRQLAGLVAGAGTGGTITGTTSTFEALTQRTGRSVEQQIVSASEQDTIDNIVTYAQSSKLNGRMQDRFADFLRANNSPREVFITPEGVKAAVDAGLDVPQQFIAESELLNNDVTMDVATFATDVASNPELMNVVRPHVRLSSDSLSVNEMEQHNIQLEQMVQRAEQSKELKDEADRIYEDVKQQLIDTGRQSESTARYSAQLIPAYVTVKAEQTGLSVKEVYERMGLGIVGPATQMRQEGRTLEQATKIDSESQSDMVETGKPITFRYAHNKDSATAMFGIPEQDAPFERGFEPSGKYMTLVDESFEPFAGQNMEVGNITLNNPLIVDMEDGRWKEKLSTQYDGKTGKDLSKAVIADGYDGIVTKRDSVVDEIVDFTSFDEAKALYQSEVEQEARNLFVAHNISEAGIAAAEDLGGLAAPSIAVANLDVGGFESFGEITLLADPELLNDPTFRTFDADIYSARQPRSVDQLDQKKVRQLSDDVDQVNQGTGLRPFYEVQEISDLDKDNVFNYWLTTVGKSPKLKKIKPTPLSKAVEGIETSNLAESEQLKQAVAEKYKKFVDDILGENPTDAETELAMDIAKDWFNVILPEGVELRWLPDEGSNGGYAYFKGDERVSDIYSRGSRSMSKRLAEKRYADELIESGDFELDFTSPKQGIITEAINDIRKVRDGFDQELFAQDLAKKNQNKKLRADFKEWMTDTYKNMLVKRQLFKGYTPAGDRKYAEYTLNNVVREMTKTLQGGEGFNYGVASVRSRYANELSTKERVQASRSKIVSSDEMSKIKDEAAEKFEKALEELKPYYKFDSDSWGYGSDVAEAITQGPKEIREVFGNNPEAKKIIDDLGKYLASLPTEYFESKVQRAMDFSEFNTAIVPKDASKKTVDILKSKGLKIRRYDSNVEGDRAEVITKQTKLLFQDAEGEKHRGSIEILDNEHIIKLGQASDLSTFIHESAHLFLEMEGKFAAEFGTSADQQQILDWLGADSFENITVDQHEQFARGFEAYTREGKAPSTALRAAFDAFRRWLTNIYRKLTQLNVELNDDIRGVFDRLLATEREIEEALSAPNYDELFRSKEQAGMTDAQWEKYQETIAKRKGAATQSLDEKLIKELTRRKTQEWNEEKQPLIDDHKERLNKLPVYQLLADAKEYPMDYNALKQIIGFDKLPGKLIGRAKKDGIDPQEYAESYGYNNVEQMYNAMIDAEPVNKAADEMAENQMIAKYGDILNDGSIEMEAREAVHNEEQASLLLQELNALKPKRSPDINRDVIKAEAKRVIRTMTYKEIKPNKYNRAEIRAAQNAARATNKDDQYRAKLQQLTNHYLYREAVRAREDMIKQRKYIRKVQTREFNSKQVNPEYIQNMKVLANLYDMRQQPAQQVALDNVLNWYQTQIADQNEFVNLELLDHNLIKALNAKLDGLPITDIKLPTFDDLTAEDLQSTYDMLRHMRYVGGQMSDVAKAEFAKTVDDVIASITEQGGRDVKDVAGLPTKHAELKRKFSHMVNALPSLRNLVRKLDGFKTDTVFDAIYRPIEEANSRKIELNAEMYHRFEDELNEVHNIGLVRTDAKTYLLDSGMSIDIDSEKRFMLALYWGTETSRDAVRDGFGMSDSDVSRILADMTPEQVNMVNTVWKVNESMWPELSAASVRLYGVAPPKLENAPFSINGVPMTGGHMRLFYDSTELEMKTEQESASKMSSIVPSRAGSLYARIGSGGRPVLLDRNNITRAMEDNVHFVAFAESSRQVASIVNNKKVKDAIERKHGRGFNRAFVDNLESITGNRPAREALPMLAGLMRLLRKAATFKHLAYSIRNTVQQITSIPVAMEEVGFTPFVGAITRFSSPEGNREITQFVNERSKFMKERASLVNREASEYLNKMEISGKAEYAWNQFARYGFTPQTIVDSLVAYPTWIAKYEASMEQHGDESKAISDADTAVAESVGSGSDLHLGSAFHKNQSELTRTLTVFGSWFNAYYQRIYKTSRGFTSADVDTAKALITTPFIVAVLSALVIMDYPDDDSDESWSAWAAKKYISFMGGTVPLLRDIVSSLTGYTPKPLITSGAESIPRVINELQAGFEGKQTPLKTVSDITKAVTTVVPVPGAGNVTRVLDFVDSDSQGKEKGTVVGKTYQALVEGPNRN